ncbi:MAG: ABC transporter substrate-binding protein [Aeromonas sp.]
MRRINILSAVLRGVLLASAMAPPLASAADDRHVWAALSQAARGSTVTLHGWGGSAEVNAYLHWASGELKRQHAITLRVVKVDDIHSSVQSLLAQRGAGGAGQIDLLWINGENFHTLKHAGLLGAPFTQHLPHMALVDPTLNLTTDLAEATAGLEAPWGLGQLHFLLNRARVATPPQDATSLLRWAHQHPGRFSYPHPQHFLGLAFLTQLLHEFCTACPLTLPVSEIDFARHSAPLWAWLDQLHPHLWRQGRYFSRHSGQLWQALDDGELDMALSFNPAHAAQGVYQGTLPPHTQAHAFARGALTNAHYWAIPATAPNRAGALVVINFFLSPAAQARKADSAVWGDPSVLFPAALAEFRAPQTAASTHFKALAEPHPSWRNWLRQYWQVRYR